MEEKFDLEFKEKISKTFLKTVSAFSNYNDGKIIFGINNLGEVVGIEASDNQRLKIENMINDSVDPVPKYKIEIREIEGKTIIEIQIYKGDNTPYYYRGKTYKRSDTSTVEVDRFELNRLILQGLNIDYEERESLEEKLEFTYLEQYLRKEVGVDRLNLDILKTLKLYNKDGYYNIAGELLSDKNNIRFSGIDIVRFGESINQILDRETLTGNSILWHYDKAIEIFERYYQFEEIEGFNRVKKELIPREAFREAIANAIVHRNWDINSYIQISMYEDRIEITSPGGLPTGISKEDYISKNISILINPIIAGVFYRLNLIEQFGTGIKRIIKEYEDSFAKPKFDISQNYITIILPILQDNVDLTQDEKTIYNIIKENVEIFRKELDDESGFNKSKTLRVINSLLDKDLIVKQGKGINTRYLRS
ncbi:MAG: AAA family ATPase [Tissierellia bacterium]|nr:AAA family ATPase [Tissierellia bacterium]